MTRDDDFIGQLEGYLEEYEGSTPLPDEVREAIRAQLPSIQQRPASWLARRTFAMHPMLRFGAAVTAVAIVSLLTYIAMSGGIRTGPAPSPTQAAATPIPVREAFEPLSAALRNDGHVTRLEFDLPTDGSLSVDTDDFEWQLRVHDGAPGEASGATWGINIADVAGATNHRDRFENDVISGDDPASFLDGLAATGSYLVGESTEVQLDGRAALVTDIAPAVDPTVSGEGYPHLDVSGAGGVSFDRPNRVYLMEVGSQILMIQVWAATDAALAIRIPLAERIVGSMRFQTEP